MTDVKIQNNSSNTVQAFWVAIGSFFAFGFSIISAAILSRYFSKGDYGTYKQVLYVYSTLLSIFTLGLPKAFSYFLPRVPIEQAKHVINKITNLFFLLGGLFSVLLFVFSGQIAIFLKNPDLALALKIFSPVPFLMLPTMGLEGILSTFRMTKFMAVYTISTRMLMLLCVALPVILFNVGYIEAIIGFVIASFVTFLLAIYFKYLPVKDKGDKASSLAYKEIFRFSLPLLTASLWGLLLRSTDQFFISRYFGTEVFAEFSNGATDLPFIGMIIGATATVLSPIFSRLSHQQVDPKTEIYPIWMSVFKKSAMLIYPLLIYAIVFADVLMVFLYGEKYVDSGIYFRIYNIVNFLNVIVYAPLIINIGKVTFYQNVHMVSALLLILIEYLIIYWLYSPYAIAVASLLISIGKSMAMLLFVSNYFKVKFYQLFPLGIMLKILIPSLIILLGLRYIFNIYSTLNSFGTLIITFGLYSIFFYIVSRLAKLDYITIVKPILSKVENRIN